MGIKKEKRAIVPNFGKTYQETMNCKLNAKIYRQIWDRQIPEFFYVSTCHKWPYFTSPDGTQVNL